MESTHLQKMDELEAMKLLKKYKIPVEDIKLARNLTEARDICKRLGFPVALKVFSPTILHKTDVGGIVLNVKNFEELKRGFKRIVRNVKEKAPKAKIEGILIQKMLKGFEVIIGCKRDPQFGPILLFGAGGIYVEVYEDIAMRVLPVSKKDVREMILETKCSKVLLGYRGKKYDVKALEDILLKISKLVKERKEIEEIDLNPTMVFQRGARVIDARILIKNFKC